MLCNKSRGCGRANGTSSLDCRCPRLFQRMLRRHHAWSASDCKCQRCTASTNTATDSYPSRPSRHCRLSYTISNRKLPALRRQPLHRQHEFDYTICTKHASLHVASYGPHKHRSNSEDSCRAFLIAYRGTAFLHGPSTFIARPSPSDRPVTMIDTMGAQDK